MLKVRVHHTRTYIKMSTGYIRTCILILLLTDATVVCIYIYEESLITSATFYAALLMSVVTRFVKKNKMSTEPMP